MARTRSIVRRVWQADGVSVLERVLAALGPDRKGHFCLRCGAPVVETEVDERGERFLCGAGHALERSFLFDGRAVYAVEGGRLVHESVGAIVRRETRLLLFHRCRFPIGWTIPAGHREVGCKPEREVRREVLEEVGLEVVDARPVWDEPVLLSDRCRRGADLHRWHLFEAEVEGEVRLGEEGDGFGWYSPEQVERLDLIPPVREILRRVAL
jgi:8-oxo-dGTP pyrophosphatase MutT (NUDIX family)